MTHSDKSKGLGEDGGRGGSQRQQRHVTAGAMVSEGMCDQKAATLRLKVRYLWLPEWKHRRMRTQNI